MAKELIFSFAAFFMLSLTAITGVFANEEHSKIITISKNSVDITGDGKKDSVYMQAIPYQDEHSFLKSILVDIKASNGKNFKIKLDSGTRPSISFPDLNHDGVKDLFIVIPTGGSGGILQGYLYTLKGFVLKDLTIPKALEIESHFLNGYKAEINIKASGKTYQFDLRDRKKQYDLLGLYRLGRLNEPTELMVQGYSVLKPISLPGQMKGLRAIQRISGIANSDTIGIVESVWALKNNIWNLERVSVLEEKNKQQGDRKEKP